MVKVVITITHPPFGHEYTFAGLYVASASLSKGYDVTVILYGDGVYTGRSGQIESLVQINLPPTDNQVKDIIELDGRVVAEKNSMDERGISKDELIEGVEVLDISEIHDILLDHGEKVIAF